MKLVIFSLFLTVHSFSYAFWGEKTYQLKVCKIPSEAYQCSVCKEDFQKAQFSVNRDKSFVTMHIVNEASVTFENCKILDKENWDCSVNRVESNWVDKKYRVMRKGVYTHIWEHGFPSNLKVLAHCGR